MWYYNLLLQGTLADGAPEPPAPSGSSTSTPAPVPTACVGVTLEQFNAALADLRAFIFTELADVRSDIVNAIPPAQDCATSADLTEAKNEILSAIADISVTPPPAPTSYALLNGVQYAKLSDAAAVAGEGAIVEIYGELRDLDATAAFLNSATIRGMTPDAKLNWTLGTAERMAFGKGHIVCAGAGKTYLVENLEICGARVVDRNGAGVRGDAAASVTVRNCNIHDNENGILSIATVLNVNSGCVFKNNGNSSGNGHNIYVNSTSVAEVTVEGNTLYTALVGNQVKSRAKKTTVRQNTIAELDGSCSWQIDISNGGEAVIDRNVIEQGINPDNWNMVSYAPEGIPADGRVNSLTVTGNILLNDYTNANGINVFSVPAAHLIEGNTFVGAFDNQVIGLVPGSNTTYTNRAAAGYGPYPFLPGVPV